MGWSEWNDRYRDVFRASQNKLGFVSVTPGSMATRFAGSSDLFAPRERGPWNSINYIVCHDGFTLRDLYSYNQPNNDQPYPYGPSSDGRSAQDEMCWNHNGDRVATDPGRANGAGHSALIRRHAHARRRIRILPDAVREQQFLQPGH